MKNLKFEYVPNKDIIDLFGEEKIRDRFDTLYSELECFLSQEKLADCVSISKLLLSEVIIDYFNDIKRIKDFHTSIEKANSEKVIAYTSYWFLQRKPLQVIDSSVVKSQKLSTINERFVLQYICSYLSARERETHLLLRKNVGLKNFSSFLMYYLIYRLYNAQSLEMILTAFMAGQIYENTEVDISDELHPYDILES